MQRDSKQHSGAAQTTGEKVCRQARTCGWSEFGLDGIRISSMVFGLSMLIAAPAVGRQATTTIVSVDSSGNVTADYKNAPVLSDDGRFVAFESYSATLVAGDTNNSTDIFVRDRQAGLTTRVSVGSGGTQAGSYSSGAAISSDGRFVAFASAASNLVPLDTNGKADLFVHDRLTAQTTRVSVSSAGNQGNGSCSGASLSSDGRFVAFSSLATNLVAGDTNGFEDVFVHDRQTGQTTCVSVDSNGAAGNGISSLRVNGSDGHSISFDGRFVAFKSMASNFAPGDTNGSMDVFVHDRQSGLTSCVSVTSSGILGNSFSYEPSLSRDGRFVAFLSISNNLVPNDTNATYDIFLHDRQAGQTTRVSVDSNGNQGNGQSDKPSVSADGRFVSFQSNASNLVAGDTNASPDIFVRDRQSGQTTRVSVSSNGTQTTIPAGNPPFHGSKNAAISGDGRFVVFECHSDNLIPNDWNQAADIFLRDRGAIAPATNYCTPGTTSLGCVPAISGSGTPSVSASSGFTISATNIDGQVNGLLFYGLSASTGSPWAPGSSSFLCVKSPTQRLPLQSTGGTVGSCNGSLAVDFLAFLAANPSSLGQPFSVGDIVYAQAWFRDPPSPKSTSLSAGLVFTLLP